MSRCDGACRGLSGTRGTRTLSTRGVAKNAGVPTTIVLNNVHDVVVSRARHCAQDGAFVADKRLSG